MAATSFPIAFTRGHLRPWRPEDAPAFAQHADCKEVWACCSDRWAHPFTEAAADAWIAGCMSAAPPGAPPLQLAIVHDTAGVVGGIGVSRRTDVQRFTVELGFWLGRAFWGAGIGSAAVAAFLPYAWHAAPDAARIEALVYAFNERSCRLLERLGFTREGRLARAAFKDGRFCDSIVFGLLRPDGADGAAEVATDPAGT